jgi:hypothetical protein
MDKKFTDIIEISDYEVWTHQGFVPFSRIGQTIEYDVYELKLDDDKSIKCADNHILSTIFGLKYAKDIVPFIDVIYTSNGFSPVVSIKKLEYSEVMYDLELISSYKDISITYDPKIEYETSRGSLNIDNILSGDYLKIGDRMKEIVSIKTIDEYTVIQYDDIEHLYYTNGILSHNTMFLTHLTKDFLVEKKNVLYITLEMSEFEISKRIDAYLLNIEMRDFNPDCSTMISNKFENLPFKDLGELIVKEYPSGACTVVTIRNLIKQLLREKKFRPDVICVDQINTMGDIEKNSQTYLKIKNIVEGLKAISSEYDCVVISATQSNREGLKKVELDMDNVSESMATAQIADTLIGIMKEKKNVDELADAKSRYSNKVICTVIKNRLNGTAEIPKFVLEQDLRYMRLSDVSHPLVE